MVCVCIYGARVCVLGQGKAPWRKFLFPVNPIQVALLRFDALFAFKKSNAVLSPPEVTMRSRAPSVYTAADC